MTTAQTRSELLYEEACRLMPGGVNSPVRAFRAVGGTPIFFDKASGAHLTDADGKSYIDYVCSWGAIVLGHRHHAVTAAVSDALHEHATSFGAPHEGEIKLARLVLDRVPHLDMIRFVNSGTEATAAAIRLSRAATKRSKILKFEGNYHGASDGLLAKAGSGVATFGLPDTEGVPTSVAADTLVARYNDADHVEQVIRANEGQVAAVLVEPVAGNMGCVPPVGTFLHDLRTLCTEHGALLIIDEVMTGFRVSRGGALELYGLEPDIACFGKIIGGGLPVGAYAGRRELMEMIAPVGPVYQAGTLSGNPLAMAAGAAALEHLTTEVYETLEMLAWRLQDGLQRTCDDDGVAAQVQRVGSMISVFFNDKPVTNFEEAQRSDKVLFAKVFHRLLEKGVYLPPSALEAWFLTFAHTEKDIDQTVAAFAESLREALG